MRFLGPILLLFCASGLAQGPRVDFAKDIQPILKSQCIECHGPDKSKGSLRLDVRPLALKGGLSGPSIISGNSEKSPLVRRIRGLDDEDQMPQKKPALPKEQIDLIAAWIDQGADWPESADAAKVAVKKHWSFVKPIRPAEPTVKDETWARNAIDRFVLARLEKEGIKPAAEASKETLLRRVSLDLIGLPPTPKEIDAFLADDSTDAYEKVVDRLLASPHYGERQARHWLDAARYADSNGYSIDAPRSIWKYRDWVINAFNTGKSFDQFIVEQLAGDMLPTATVDDRIATGFHRNTQINEEGGIDPEQFRVEAVIDRVGTTATVFLGLTVACAQCHNHKFDPISQREYYQIFAFLNNQDEPKIKVADGAGEQTVREEIARLEAELKHYDEPAFASLVDQWEAQLSDEAREKLKPAVRAALAISSDKRSDKHRESILTAFKAQDPDYPAKKNQIDALKKQLGEGVTTLVLAERNEPRKTHIFIKGDFTRPGDPVSPGVLSVLHPLRNDKPLATRLDLAHWLIHPDNPLTARVTVNRFWQQFFGRGLVETENDFGTQGSVPTHPELLDHLATEFLRQGWSVKKLHRLIVTSAAYRQSSNFRSDLATIDPYNKLLARQNRLRLDAEIVRDVCLTASGLLSSKVGGPSVFPPQPDGVLSLGQVRRTWKVSAGPDRYRRGMYTFFYRATPHPLLNTFDAPDGTASCTRRIRSNTPLQSLTLLNDEAFVEFATALAERVKREAAPDDDARIDYAFRLCTARTPKEDERGTLRKLIKSDDWNLFCRVLLNLDETITRE